MKKEMQKKYDVIVIGGGASGLMSAGIAAKRGKKVLLIEKNPECGKKLSITGGGRCNITNDTRDPHIFLEKFPESKKFLYGPFAQFAVDETVTFFQEELNLPLMTQAKNRMFPTSEKAPDVTKALVTYAKKCGVEILCNTTITNIETKNNRIISISTKNETIQTKKVILATGGLAAPETGSTGDGFRFLEKIGHTVQKPSPNIVPLKTSTKWLHKCAGTKLTETRITFAQSDTKIKKDGDILLTHVGLSGPTILNSAKEVQKLLKGGSIEAHIDLFPQKNEGELDKDLLSLFTENPKKKIVNLLPEIIPRALARELIQQKNINLTEAVAKDLSREKRKALVRALKKITCTVTDTLDFDKAVIADGGVIPEEIDFQTMQSRLYPNLYCIGDTICINRPSGGYSLQLCWTTAWVAAQNI